MSKYFILLAFLLMTGCSISPKLTIGREGDVIINNNYGKADTVIVIKENHHTDTLTEVIRVDPFGPLSSKDGLYGERISRPQTTSSSWKELEFESGWLFGVSADFKFGKDEKGFSFEAGKNWLWENNAVELGTSAAASYSYIGGSSYVSVVGLGRAGFGSSWKGYISIGGTVGAKNFDTIVAHPVVEIGASHSEGLEVFVRGSFIKTITSVGIRFVI